MDKISLKYNDYELIYLIRDNNEKAFNFFFEKYEIYIKKIAIEYYHYGDKMQDLIQEGRIVLLTCLKSFNENMNVTFFSYFSICLRRIYKRLLRNDYYSGITLKEDSVFIDKIADENTKHLYSGKRFYDDELLISIFDECIIGNMTLTDFAKKYNIKYNLIYRKYKTMVSELKNILTII